MGWRPIANDFWAAVKLATASQSEKLIRTWIFVPAGVLVMLAACFGVDVLFKKVNVSFPASVACLLLLFLGLLGCEVVIGGHRTRKLVALIDVPAGWSLRWINVFFAPAFVMLPLSPSIGAVEVMKIIAVFIVGFFVMMVLAAYLTRGLQVALGSSKRAQVQRAEELGENTDDILLAGGAVSTDQSRATSISRGISSGPLQPSSASMTRSSSPDIPQAPPQLRLQGHHYSRHESSERSSTDTSSVRRSYPQDPPPPPRAEHWAALLTANFDLAIFVTVFLFVGLPVYYVVGYAMPVQLSANVVAFMAALAIPLRWRQYLHPVLVAAFITVFVIWPLAEIRGDSLDTGLRAYKTGTTYLVLWEEPGEHYTLPGAGDIFSSLLDASIVSLALPMFQYRRELKEHFVSIVVPNVLISIGSLFAYPLLCVAIGISAERSLAFTARSLTLALALPATKNLGGDTNTVAAVAIVSGILGVLIGKQFLDWLRIPEDDYVTRGVTLGVNSSAIATAQLLRTDPRAAALSTLSMSLFGTVTVLFTSIPPMVTIIRSLAGI